MTAKNQAILDIKEDLEKQSKSFIAFRSNLNPIMRHLTLDYLRKKGISKRQKSQLIAHCLFSKGSVIYSNYEKYYG